METTDTTRQQGMTPRIGFGFDVHRLTDLCAAAGIGLTPAVAIELFDAGVDVLTSGNHIWGKKEILPFLEEEAR